MKQWEIWYVHQKYARRELNPPQPNDPSPYNRMYVLVASPYNRDGIICCPIQNKQNLIRLTEVELKDGCAGGITKDCKVVCHDIFTLPKRFFEKMVGILNISEQQQIQVSLRMILEI